MNNRFLFSLALLACFVLNASAQFSNSGSSSTPTQIGDNKGWNTIYVEWNPSTLVYTGKADLDDISFNGFSVGYNRAISLLSNTPLFLETGIAGQFSIKKEEDNDNYYKLTEKLSIISLKVPVNLVYRVDIPGSSIDLVPFAGFTIRGNLWGQHHYELNYDGNSKSENFNLFDKDDMDKLDSYTWKRIQFGWQIGLKALFAEKLLIGGSYGTDFSEIVKTYKVHTGTVCVGYKF